MRKYEIYLEDLNYHQYDSSGTVQERKPPPPFQFGLLVDLVDKIILCWGYSSVDNLSGSRPGPILTVDYKSVKDFETSLFMTGCTLRMQRVGTFSETVLILVK